ncbi:peptide ABC transporter substrate-binding protein [Magnetospira sp. QH-2]|uniref:peptide ABC transporter substrate-binding protein n=1 Tax=Magnetospira sp. (strain QH-2) TaxID=1288970 RepID=UPI0003E818E4|nr:peptide ABC transporter substrate-binding protein [Magnetospira sp. QH-2]CCQ73257.1 Oligopeptide ABC transporter (oligopeptide-binding lipoprotein); C-terminal part of AppA [Magnetospira sp. QH-2]
MRVLLLAALLVLSSMAAQARDSLTIGLTQFPSTFHPSIDSMAAKSYILGLARRPLTTHDADWNVVCMLCVDLPTLENGGAIRETTADGKPGIAVTYRLHPKATWGDGQPVRAEDVVFTWEVGRHPKVGVGNLELYRSITAIDVIDAKTVTIHFDKISFDYNALNDFEVLPAHLDQAAFEADPESYRKTTVYDTDTTNPGLYFGPYRIAEVVTGSHVVLIPNPTWYGKPPAFKRIVVRVIGNTAALEANLLSGGLDMIAGELGVTLDQALAFEKRHGKKVQILYEPGLVYEHLDLNLSNPILADKRVRKAMLMAIDRQAMSEKLFAGKQPVAQTSVSPLDWVHAPEVVSATYDLKAAGVLLDQAGWRMGTRGLRRNAEGDLLSLEIMTTAGNRTRELVEQVIQAQLKQVGIELKIRNQPARVFFGETVTRRQFTGLALFAWISSPENVPRTTLHSGHIPTAENNWAGQNYTGYSNPDMDRLLETIDIELDRDKRRALWRRLQEIYAEDLPVLPLYFRANAHILPKWLTGLKPTGHMAPSTYWVEEWGETP